MRNNRITSIVIAFVAACLDAIPDVASAHELVLELQSVKSQYVLHEPVKFCVTFKNTSQSEIRIPHYYKLEGEMDYMHMDIIYPDGSRRQRAAKWFEYYGFYMEDYRGMPFAGGKSFTLCYYPNQSIGFDPAPFTYLWNDLGPTFPVVGQYRIKFVYQAPGIYKNLYRPSVESNEVVISVVAPSIEEKEIFDAYWLTGAVDFADYSCGNHYDRKALLNVLEKYPGNPMIKYAKFGLAVDYVCNVRSQSDRIKGLELLNEIAREYPDYRYYEVQMFRLFSYMDLKEAEAGRKLYKKLLRMNKDLLIIPKFVGTVSGIEDGIATSDKAIMRAWREQMTSRGDVDELYEMLVAE